MMVKSVHSGKTPKMDEVPKYIVPLNLALGEMMLFAFARKVNEVY